MTTETPAAPAPASAERPAAPWWQSPFRMFQTNLREADAVLDVNSVLDAIEAHGANAWLVNGGGICSFYPSALPFQTVNPFLAQRPSGDMLGDAVQAAHARGIKVIARMDFSKVATPVAQEHPEWCFVAPDGTNQVYHGLYSVCPNGDYYQQRAFEVIEEIVERYPVDGFFFNWLSFNEMDYSYRYRGVCHCARCSVGFAEASGGKELPTGPDDATYTEWLAYSAGVLDQLTARFRTHVAAKAPGAALIQGRTADIMFHEANNALGRELWPSATSDAVSEFKTHRPNVPVLVNSVAFIDMPYRLASEQPEHFASYLVQAIARGAIPSTYIMGVPGDIKYGMLEVAGEVTRFHRDHEDLYDQLRPAATIALVKPDRLRMEADKYANSMEEYRGVATSLQERNKPYDVLLASDITDVAAKGGLERFRIVILPDLGPLEPAAAEALDHYVFSGGSLVATGTSAVSHNAEVQLQSMPANRLLATHSDRETLKNTYVGDIDPNADVAVRQPQEVAPVLGAFHFYEWKADAQPASRLLSQAPFGPPEKTYGHRVTSHPGTASREHGDGAAVVIPWTLGRTYRETALTTVREQLMSVLDSLEADPEIVVDLPEQTEVIIGNVKGRRVLHIINRSGLKRRGYGPAIPVSGGTVTVQGKAAGYAHVAGTPLNSTSDGNTTVLTLPVLGLFEVITLD
ncbi:alpha-amylase family protein [Arthrobacter sp. MPF02]|uniref:alpha-amylase family protein n=1 Tax=Arthrobacter sp. MPF02 TaxID=3388492 RepID=UPI0039852D92